MTYPQNVIFFDGHQGHVNQIAFLPRYEKMVTVCNDGELGARVYDACIGTQKLIFEKQKKDIDGVAVLGACIVATGNSDGILCIWRASAGSVCKGSHYERLVRQKACEGLWPLAVARYKI